MEHINLTKCCYSQWLLLGFELRCFMVWEITNDYKLWTGRDTNKSSNGLL